MLVVGCVTTPKRGTKKPRGAASEPAVPQDKPGSKAPPDEPLVTDPGGKKAPPSLNSQLKFIRLHSRTSSKFGPPEHEYVTGLPVAPRRGTVAEASIVVGIMNRLLHPLDGDTASFQEEDLMAGNKAADTMSKPLLKKSTDQFQVDVAGALRQNRWLQHYGVHKLVYETLKITGDSPAFKKPILAEIVRQAQMWGRLGEAIEADRKGSDTPGKPESPSDNLAAIPLSPADLKSGDAILMEAQTLADRGRYRDAITIIDRISEDDPMHEAAQEKKLNFSNSAVQDLRRKAAQAFQKAIPVTEPRARAAYLEEAKAYLEEAINTYPEADQLPTVRNNLDVISRDLDRLQEETASEG